jgi:radical SAM protein (TIGR01212 family)
MERWHTLASWMKETYGHRLYRVPLDGGFTCPNRDGTVSTGGCIFCSGKGSGEFAIPYHGQKLKAEDLIYNRDQHQEGWYLGYFQAFTGTYAPASRLRMLYEGILDNDLFAGIDIATRPDCLGPDILALLQELKGKYPAKVFMVELGLQTMHEDTARFLNRGYARPVFEQAVSDLNRIGISVIVHVIIGLPKEDEQRQIETIQYLDTLKIQGIKISSLQIIRGTKLAEMAASHPEQVPVLTEEQYVHAVCMCLGWLRKDIVIHRLTGDGDQKTLIGPLWACRKGHVLNEIRHEMKELDLVQGKYWEGR